MKYTKPEVVAQNRESGSYAAGCPSNTFGSEMACKNCERSR